MIPATMLSTSLIPLAPAAMAVPTTTIRAPRPMRDQKLKVLFVDCSGKVGRAGAQAILRWALESREGIISTKSTSARRYVSRDSIETHSSGP